MMTDKYNKGQKLDTNDGIENSGGAGCQRQGGSAAFQGGHAVFKDLLGGVHKACIDIS